MEERKRMDSRAFSHCEVNWRQCAAWGSIISAFSGTKTPVPTKVPQSRAATKQCVLNKKVLGQYPVAQKRRAQNREAGGELEGSAEAFRKMLFLEDHFPVLVNSPMQWKCKGIPTQTQEGLPLRHGRLELATRCCITVSHSPFLPPAEPSVPSLSSFTLPFK